MTVTALLRMQVAFLLVAFLLIAQWPQDARAQPNAPRVEDLHGVWTSPESGSWLLIEPLYARDRPEALKLTTNNGEWGGVFTPGTAPKPARAMFIRDPKSAEMNAEIPAWARRAVEGKLRWQLELDEDDDALAGCLAPPRLKARWYPGEVTWLEQAADSDGPSAWVSGRGKPVELVYEKSDIDLELVSRATVTLYPANRGAAHVNRIGYLTKLQPFAIEATLPRDEARRLGNALAVEIVGKRGGSRTSVMLEAAPASPTRPVVTYRHPDEIVIADFGQEPNRESTLGPIPAARTGRRIALSAGNAEEVEFTFAGAQQSVVVYDTWVQAGVARHEEAFRRYAAAFEAIRDNPRTPPAAREEAHQRRRLIENARAIIRAETDWIGYHAGAVYLGGEGNTGLLLRHNMKWFRPPNQPQVNQYGFIWGTSEEWDEVIPAIIRRRAEYRDDAIRDVSRAAAFALYKFVAVSTGAEDVLMVVSGIDAFGARVDFSERVLAAVGLVTQAATLGAGTLHNIETATSLDRINRLGARARSERVSVAGTAVRPIAAPSAGATPRPPPRPSAPPPRAAAPEPPAQCKPPPSTPQLGPQFTTDLTHLPPGTRLKYPEIDNSRFLQLYNHTCWERAISKAAADADRPYVREIDGVAFSKEMGIWDPAANRGAYAEEMIDYAAAAHNASATEAQLSLKGMDTLQKAGLGIVNTIKLKGGGMHAVTLQKVVFDPSGRPIEVEYMDPDSGHIVVTPAEAYCRILPNKGQVTGGITEPSNSLVLRFQ